MSKLIFIYIEEKNRRKGYGSFLLKYIENKTNNKKVGLVAFTTSPHSLALFLKQKYNISPEGDGKCAIVWKDCV